MRKTFRLPFFRSGRRPFPSPDPSRTTAGPTTRPRRGRIGALVGAAVLAGAPGFPARAGKLETPRLEGTALRRRTLASPRLVPPPRALTMPIGGLDPGALHDSFDESRGGSRRHEAIDILAPRGTPVQAVDDGVVRKLFTSVPGGLTVYHYDPNRAYCYYYAHLDRYAEGLHEGQVLRRGDVIGYVGSTGNAPANVPHLHFALYRLDPDERWWTGTPVNPFPYLAAVR